MTKRATVPALVMLAFTAVVVRADDKALIHHKQEIHLEYRAGWIDPEIPLAPEYVVPSANLPFRADEQTLPDESRLWSLLHAGLFNEAAAQLALWRSERPSWTPPEEFIQLLSRARWQVAFDTACRERHAKEIIALAIERPAALDCAHLDRRWALARAYDELGQEEACLATFDKAMRDCRAPRQLLSTLETARGRISKHQLETLIERAAPRIERSPLREPFETFRDETHLAWLSAALTSPVDAAKFAWVEGLAGPALKRRRQRGMARALGWYHLAATRAAQAAAWFGAARAWEEHDEEAAYGLLLSLRERALLERARTLGRVWSSSSERIAKLHVAQLREDAAREYEAAHYESALNALREAAALTPPGRDERVLEAWTLLALERPAEAAPLFAMLYAGGDDDDIAEGLLATCPGGGCEDRLRWLAAGPSGALARGLRERRAARLEARGWLRAAHIEAPWRKPELEGIASPLVGAASALRSKSGQTGEDRLRLIRLPVAQGQVVHSGEHEIGVGVEVVSITSGQPDLNRPFGAASIGKTPASPALVESSFRGLAGELSYRHVGRWTRAARIGLTPSAGPLAARVKASCSLTFEEDEQSLKVEVYSRPVRDSLLSFVGQNDPYGTGAWGGVDRRGGRFAYQHRLDARWRGRGEIDLAQLTGTRVASNRRLGLTLSASRAIPREGLRFLSVGPILIFESFRDNLSHFTLGHGGYFSPQHLVMGGVALDFQTLEAHPFMAQGHAQIGFQSHSEDSVALLPLSPDSRAYEGSSDADLSWSAEAMAGWRLRPGLLAAAGLSIRRTAGYKDYGLVVSLRYSLGGRATILSTDLPIQTLSSIY